jgi:hypothetical protein
MVDRQAELDRINKEAEAVQSEMWRMRTQMQNLSGEISEMQEKLDSIDMKCYENTNNTCLAHLDGYLVALNAILRLNVKSRNEKDTHCWLKVPYSLRPKDEFRWEVKSQEGLDELKKYFNCARPYYEMGITQLFDELSLKKQVHKKISGFVKT